MPSAPYVPDATKDLFLNAITDADRAAYLTGDPTDFNDADTLAGSGGKKLGERNLSVVGVNGPLDGDTSGRKISLLKGGFVADEGGSVTRLALLDDDNTEIKAIFVLDDGNGNPLSVTQGVGYNNLETDLELRDAS